MNFRKLMTALALTLVFSVSYAKAQNQPQQAPDNGSPQAPIPPVTPDDSGAGDNGQPPVPAAAVGGLNASVPDTTIQPGSEALGGPTTFSIVSPTGQANVFDPSFHVSVGPDNGVVPGEVNADATLGVTLAFKHFWTRNEFITQYQGGFNMYSGVSGDDSQYHLLSVADITQHQRTTLQFRDDFSDSYGAVFGGLNTGGPGLTVPTGFISSLAPAFTLAQTILTANANRIGNTGVGEVDYALSRRTSLTFAGTDEILHFLASGYIDSDYVDGRVGYSYVLNRKNAVALTYDYNYTTFSGVGASAPIASQTAQFAYGLTLSGRLAFQFSGGPQIIYIGGTNADATFVHGPNTSIGTSSATQWSWNFSSVLNYRVRRAVYSLAYSHGLTSGSGVFLGALSDTVTGTAATTFHRNWTPSVSGGYSDNNALSVDSATSTSFGNWFGSVGLGHVWGRTFHTNASYSLQEQTTNGAGCPVASCGSSGLRQVFTLTIDWHPLATVLR